MKVRSEVNMEKLIIGNKQFETENHCYVMGILNMTPDSFSDGGLHNSVDDVYYYVEEMIRQGMDVLDIGGESTRPGHVQISDEEEISRVLPAIEGIKQRFDIPISLDSYKSRVAKAGLEAGVDMINDIWGLKYDSEMAELIAKYDASVCLMHNRNNADYQDFLSEVETELSESLYLAHKAKIKDNKIILDPGVGFGKTYEQNLLITQNMDRLKLLGYPVLLGASKKSMIGLTLNIPIQERLAGTLATTAIAVMKGASFVRVHDIRENVELIKMMEAIIYV